MPLPAFRQINGNGHQDTLRGFPRRNQQIRFPQRRAFRLQGPQGAGPQDRRGNLGNEARAGLDAGLPPQEPGHLQFQADAALGRAISASTSRTSTTISSRPKARANPGKTCRRTSRTPSTGLGIPEAEKKHLAGVKAQYESEVDLRLASRGPGQARRDLHRHRFGRARASRSAARVLRQDHSAHGQQVRGPELGRLVGRVVRLRARRA